MKIARRNRFKDGGTRGSSREIGKGTRGRDHTIFKITNIDKNDVELRMKKKDIKLHGKVRGNMKIKVQRIKIRKI